MINTSPRWDAAQRHERLHGRETLGGAQTSTASSLRRTCASCSKSRIKCSGGTPCTYCAVKNFVCSYLPRKRRGRQIVLSSSEEQGSADGRAASTVATPGTALDWLETSTYQQGMMPVIQVQTDTIQSDRITSNDSQSSSANSHPRREPEGPTSIVGDIPDTYSLPTNWLPFDDVPLNNTLLHSLDDVPGVASATAPQSLETQASFPTLPDIHEQSLQQDQVSALIASMASNNQRKTQSDISEDPALPCTKATHYSDGAGFRESRAERYMRQRRAAYAEDHGPSPGQQVHISWISDLDAKVAAASKRIGASSDVPDTIFEELVSRLDSHATSSYILADFAAHKESLLTKSTFQLFISLYFENFHPVNPFVDRSHLSIPLWGWSLCLATAAIGSKYFGSEEVNRFGDCLCCILHELMARELDFVNSQEPLPYIQARILASVGLCQSRQPELIRCGYNAAAMAAQACLRLRLLSEDDNIGSYQDDQSLEQKWITWRFRETRRRTGLFVWLASCYFALASEHHPCLFPDQPQLRLPCREELWAAKSPQAWSTAISAGRDADPITFSAEEASRPTVPEVTLELWRHLKSQHSSNSFATIVVIHMLVHHRWTAHGYLAEALSEIPSINQPNIHVPERRYLGSVPEYIKWRNQCCDCLDVLHWEALSLSAKAEGLEDPVLLHLHLARLSLLAPVQDLLTFADQNTLSGITHMTPSNLYRHGTSSLEPRQTIKVWATQDRYKARLAVIHAGAVMWHVRRYSSDSIVEPFALFLASLVLWAYSQTSRIRKLYESACTIAQSPLSDNEDSVSPSTTMQGSSGSHVIRDSTSSRRRMPSAMQLDRPMDDELVQYFIRFGEDLRLPLEGVDDLCATEGPLQVLQEVSSLLMEQHKPWGISETYARFLQDLKMSQWEI
ncbi:transcription factor ZMS1 [Fusarium phyllophilum]|uniref:Transcription factor ZMS1 n=1 Tax=Fusarium phyllophilum TaxID=47803 RepID=A0A8H5IXH9_9HYPO|nr:transcription factor ZMS1 [Fusarium phyllophilum]